MSIFRNPKFWLNENSINGLVISPEVRAAAVAIWDSASKRTRLAMGDSSESAALMEIAAVDAVRYLNKTGKSASSENVEAILMKIFSRLLNRRAIKARRLEGVGRQIDDMVLVPSWENNLHTLLFLEKLQSCLSPKSVTILSQRINGHTWEEIAEMMRSTKAVLKGSFWREIENAKLKLRIEEQNQDRAKHGAGSKQKPSSVRSKSGRGRTP